MPRRSPSAGKGSPGFLSHFGTVSRSGWPRGGAVKRWPPGSTDHKTASSATIVDMAVTLAQMISAIAGEVGIGIDVRMDLSGDWDSRATEKEKQLAVSLLDPNYLRMHLPPSGDHFEYDRVKHGFL